MKSIYVWFLLFIMGFALTPQPTGAGPAPKLTYLEVYAVCSEAHTSWEYVGQYQQITLSDHGGKWLVVATLEYGYSNPATQFAQFNGHTMQLIGATSILDAGRNIIGYYRFWRYDGNFTSGTFQYQASSINYPYNTMFDKIQIK